MTDLFKSPIFVSKVVQLILSIICALLIEGLPPSDVVWQIEFTHAAVYGFILVNLIIVATFTCDEALSTRMRIIISGLGTFFYLVTTIILLCYYMGSEVSRRILAAGLIALLNGAIFAADCFLTAKYVID